MPEIDAVERARAHFEWGWDEARVREDLRGRGFDEPTVDEAVTTVLAEREAETRGRGLMDLGLAAASGAVCLGMVFWMSTWRASASFLRGRGLFVVICFVAGFAAIFLGIRGAMRLYQGRDE